MRNNKITITADFFMAAQQQLQSDISSADPARDASLLSAAIIKSLRSTWRSSHVYIEKWLELRRDILAIKVYDDFTGGNHVALLRKYDMSQGTLYKFIRHGEALRAKELQSGLFDDAATDCDRKRIAISSKQTLSEIHDTVCLELKAGGVSTEVADRVALTFTEWVALTYGGAAFYVSSVESAPEPSPEN